MTKPLYFAGIGARKTPHEVLVKMRKCGKVLSDLGYILRSGGARGADSAFESGYILGKMRSSEEIFLPFKKFNQHSSPLFGSDIEARKIAKEFHPRWENVGDVGRDFHARNVYQILGRNLKTPVEFILCWTPNGKIVGGTGLALRIGQHFNIPIFNFGIHSDSEISDFILSLEDQT